MIEMIFSVTLMLILIGGFIGKPEARVLENAPIADYSDTCHGLVCPVDTKKCKKIKTTSADKSLLEIKVLCIGNNGVILDHRSHSERNPYPKETVIKSVSVNSYYRMPGSEYNNQGYYNHNDHQPYRYRY